MQKTSKIIGHDTIINQLSYFLEIGKVPHSLLVSGPKYSGKFMLVMNFVQMIFSHIQNVEERISNNSLNDFLLITNTNGKEITAKEVRNITKFLSLTPGEGKYRVVLIDAVDDMNKHASNALLKVLEEPPSHTIIFLISHNPLNLLPTIKSRCHRFRINPLSYNNCRTIVGDSITKRHIAFAQNSPGLAQGFEEMDAYDIYIMLLTMIMNNNFTDIYTFFAKKNFLTKNWNEVKLLVLTLIENLIKHKSNVESDFDVEENIMLEKINLVTDIDELFSIYKVAKEIFSESDNLSYDKLSCLLIILQQIRKSGIQ